MLPSSSRLSPLAKPFTLKRGHDQDNDHGQHVRADASKPSEEDWMSCSGFGLPSIPSLDLDNYLKKERNDKDNGIQSQYREKGPVSASLIGSRPYSSVVSRILDEYGPDRVVGESNLFDCAPKMLGSCGGLHASDSDNGWCLQKDKSSIGHQDGFLFKGKDAISSPALRVDMEKGNRTSKELKLLDETCISVNTNSHEHERADAKLSRRASDVPFPFEDLVALDWEYTVTTKGTSVNTFGGQAPALCNDHDCESSVSCQSWVKQLGSSPGKHVIPPSQNIDHLQTQAFVQTRSDMDSSIVGVDISKPPVTDSLPAVKCSAQLIEPCIGHVDAEKEAIESFGISALQSERIKLGHNEIEKGDSDVDSPCWKGLSFHQSHSRASGAFDIRNPETKLVTKNSLNPLAPQFFPQNAKSWSSYEESKLVPEDSFSFLRTSPVPPTGVLPDTLNFEEEFCSSVEYSPLWPPAHNDMSDHGNKPLQKEDEKFDFFLDQRLPEENFFKDTNDTEMQTGFVGQENNMAGPAVKRAIGVPFLAAPNASGTLSKQKDSVSVLSEPTLITNTPFGASAAINMSLNIDEEVLVNTMHDLSKLILTKCHRKRSFDKLNHERIRAVIGNLLICLEGGCAKRDLMPELADLCISDNPCKYADALTVQNTESTTLRKRSHEACGSSSAVIGTHQSLEKTPSATCLDEAKISPQAQLYRTLWLEAQAELLFLKSKASTLRIEVRRQKE